MEHPKCPHCGSPSRIHGYNSAGTRRYVCKDETTGDCGRTFAPDAKGLDSAELPGLEIDGNTAELISEPYSAPPTLEQVLADWQVDTDVWNVERWKPGQSQVTMKIKQDDGTDKPMKVTNYHVRVWLVKAVPDVTEWPVITPGVIKPYKRIAIKKRGGLRRAFVYPDPQFGYLLDQRTGEKDTIHDERAISVASAILKSIQPDEVIGLGDLLDFSEQSTKYTVKPEFYFQTQPAIDRVVRWFHEHRGYTGRWREIAGNHDKRLGVNMMENAIAAYGLRRGQLPDKEPEEVAMSVDALTRMAEFDIEYSAEYPHGFARINRNLICIHGEKVGPKPGQTCTKALERPRESIIAGHVHRLECAHTTTHHMGGQRTHGFYSMGCLCRIDGKVPGVSAKPDWQQAVGVVYFDDDFFQVTQVPIFNGRAVFEGKTYEAEVGDAG